jgi:hypothetical protein
MFTYNWGYNPLTGNHQVTRETKNEVSHPLELPELDLLQVPLHHRHFHGQLLRDALSSASRPGDSISLGRYVLFLRSCLGWIALGGFERNDCRDFQKRRFGPF